MNAEKITIHGTLVAKQDGIYKNYVFKNIDEEDKSLYKYITVTQCPNWQNVENIKIGDTGFVTFEYAKAGDEYLEVSTNTIKQFKYTAFYFMNFIKDIKNTKDKNYKF